MASTSDFRNGMTLEIDGAEDWTESADAPAFPKPAQSDAA